VVLVYTQVEETVGGRGGDDGGSEPSEPQAVST